MQFTIVSIIAALAATVVASPIAGGGHPGVAHITFIGAADAEFTQDFQKDGTSHPISNVLSVSKISSSGGASCIFKGIDGAWTAVHGSGTVDVGPPQTQVYGICHDI